MDGGEKKVRRDDERDANEELGDRVILGDSEEDGDDDGNASVEPLHEAQPVQGRCFCGGRRHDELHHFKPAGGQQHYELCGAICSTISRPQSDL